LRERECHQHEGSAQLSDVTEVNLRGCAIEIPKRIIQFWIGKNPNLTLRHRAVMANLQLLNPDFEYQFFDDGRVQEFVDREFPQYRTIFDSFQFQIQRCDFFRYLVVYRYGGFYFDLDVLLASELSPLLDKGCVFPFEALTVSSFMRDDVGMDWQIGNYGFAAAPGHPFLDAVIKNCVRAQKDRNWVNQMMPGSPPFSKNEFFVINSTGPGLVSRTLAENRELAKTVNVLFPDDVCDRGTWHRFGEYGVHISDSSWRHNKSFFTRKATDYCWKWMTSRRLKKSALLGKSRNHPCQAS